MENKDSKRAGITVALLVALTPAAGAQSTTLVSVDSAGASSNSYFNHPQAISSGGRFVVFSSTATNLVPGDTNDVEDVFVHDRVTGQTSRVSVNSSGAEGNAASGGGSGASISGDGRFVAFSSFATNLVAGDDNGREDVFVHDLATGETKCVSVDPAGAVSSTGLSTGPRMSDDGRYVAFWTSAYDLAPGSSTVFSNVLVRDLTTGQTVLASGGLSGMPANNESSYLTISADGRYVAFASLATNLTPDVDTEQHDDVFVRDLSTGLTTLVSVDSNGVHGNDDSGDSISISSDGRYVAFESFATNLVLSPDSNDADDVFVHDRLTGQTTRVTNAASGAAANEGGILPAISGDGRFVAFMSSSTDLLPGGTNVDIFVSDRSTGFITRASLAYDWAHANAPSYWPVMSADGRLVVFESSSSNLVPGAPPDGVYLRDRGPINDLGIDVCLPATSGVLACPCANPPTEFPRGCDNSSATGGAWLTSTGSASLAADTVVFTTAAQRPTATSILIQGDVAIASGSVFGQGISCIGGTVHRLYTKTAANGSIVAPGFGDASVSARAAQQGNAIAPGAMRWYAVYYRDPHVLPGCPITSTYNITQTQRLQWSP